MFVVNISIWMNMNKCFRPNGGEKLPFCKQLNSVTLVGFIQCKRSDTGKR